MQRNIFFKSLKAKKTISTGKPTQKKASQNTFFDYFLEHIWSLHGWQVNKHPLPATTGILSRETAQALPPITQQPPPSMASFCSPFCLVFLAVRERFQSPSWNPLWSTDLPDTSELSQRAQPGELIFSIFFLPSPKFCWKGLWLCTLICRSTSAAQVLIWHPAPTSSIFLTNSAHKTSTFRISLKYGLDNT